MKVFVTGATGYIGFSVAKAFRSRGHVVKGLVRGKDKSHHVAKEEIVPVLGDMEHPDEWLSSVSDCDVFIHTGFDMSGEGIEIDKKTLEALKQIVKPQNRLIYTSGIWVYGNTSEPVGEEVPLNPLHIVSWRPKHEELALQAPCRVNIIRPACVYGRAGGLTELWFKSAREDRLVRVGEGVNHWALVHVDDLASGYLLTAEKGGDKEIYHFGDNSSYTVREMTEAIQRLTGDYQIVDLPFEEAQAEYGALAAGLAADQRISSAKAKNQLGWEPKHPHFLDDLKTYYEAWRTARL